MSTKKKVLITVGVFAVILALIFSIIMINVLQLPEIIKCERLTAKYGHEFEDPEVYKECYWVHDVQEVKVLEYGYAGAYVYYICGGTLESGNPWSMGVVAEFTRIPGNQWENRYNVVSRKRIIRTPIFKGGFSLSLC